MCCVFHAVLRPGYCQSWSCNVSDVIGKAGQDNRVEYEVNTCLEGDASGKYCRCVCAS